MLRLWQVCYKEVLSWPSPGGTKMPRTNPPTWHPLWHRVIWRLVIPVSGMVAVAVWSLLLARHHCNSNDGKEANHRSHPERNGRTLMQRTTSRTTFFHHQNSDQLISAYLSNYISSQVLTWWLATSATGVSLELELCERCAALGNRPKSSICSFGTGRKRSQQHLAQYPGW